ncbi:MAG: N-acetyltransferase [Prevotella sp.]|nr:N-acetyltransferase [Prevotella sp.]
MDRPTVIKVETKRQMQDFVSVTRLIYDGVEQYVPDLDGEVRSLFDPRKNPGMKFSSIQQFVAYRDNVPVGRIVGIINKKANERWGTKNVRFSMIEFIDDLEVSRALIDAVSQWGAAQGMDTLQGPLGITDFDKEGMLVEDFHLMGSVNTIYNPDYYPRHMEALGLEKEVDWVQIRINVPKEIPARYQRVAQYCREQMGLRVIKVTDDMVYHKGYGKKCFDLLNEAYEPLFGFSKLSDEQVNLFLHKYLPVIDKQLVPVIVDEKDNVVGVAITMGSLSQAIRKANGRLWPTGWYHLLKALKWKREDNAEMLLIAVRPDLQGYGVNAMFFEDLIPIYNKYGFRWAETGPQLEDNVRELSQWKPLHPEVVKRRRCYRRTLYVTDNG